MTPRTDLRIAELLVARLCHDLIGPVAAINNGAELLDEDDPDFVADAVALVGESARVATRRLQFYRFAYGFNSGGLAGPAPYQLADEFFAGTRITCDYGQAVRALSLEWQKLACNMLAIAGEALPRGGYLSLTAAARALDVEAVGEGGGPSPETGAALTLAVAVADLTARTVGAYLTGLVSRSLGCRVAVTCEPGRFRLTAAPPAEEGGGK